MVSADVLLLPPQSSLRLALLEGAAGLQAWGMTWALMLTPQDFPTSETLVELGRTYWHYPDIAQVGCLLPQRIAYPTRTPYRHCVAYGAMGYSVITVQSRYRDDVCIAPLGGMVLPCNTLVESVRMCAALPTSHMGYALCIALRAYNLRVIAVRDALMPVWPDPTSLHARTQHAYGSGMFWRAHYRSAPYAVLYDIVQWAGRLLSTVQKSGSLSQAGTVIRATWHGLIRKTMPIA
jgi:hypothetical protein